MHLHGVPRKDATLREISDLIKGVKKQAQRRETRLDFALVYPDRTGRNVVRKVGRTFGARPSDDDDKTLQDLKFETGDFLDVAIL